MIELLGVGVPRNDGTWLLHRVCARWPRGQIVLVVSESPAKRLALLDIVAGRLVPAEGRAWLSGVPLSRETMGRARARVGDVDLQLELAERRSLLWNILAGTRPGLRTLQGLMRLPRPAERQAAMGGLAAVGLEALAHEPAVRLDREERARLAAARALLRRPDYFVIRDVDVGLGVPDAERILGLMRALVRAESRSVVASVASLSLACRFADRVVILAEGLLVLDSPPTGFTEDEIAWRLRRAPSSATYGQVGDRSGAVPHSPTASG